MSQLTTRPRPLPLWLRAVTATVLLPGMVAGVVPAWIAVSRYRDLLPFGPARWVGLLPLAAGLAVLHLTIRDFFTIGRGTLAPWDPPTALVHQHLYDRVRNPMYLGVLATIAGEAVLWSSGGLLLYGVLVAVAFHIRVVTFEEPALEREFGPAYAAYRRAVPRWIPRWGARRVA